MSNSSRNDPGIAVFTREATAKQDAKAAFEAKFVTEVCRVFKLDKYLIRDEHRNRTGVEGLSVTSMAAVYGRFPAQVAFIQTKRKFNGSLIKWMTTPEKLHIVERFFKIRNEQNKRRPLFLVTDYAGTKTPVVLTDLPMSSFPRAMQTEIDAVTLTISKIQDILVNMKLVESYSPAL